MPAQGERILEAPTAIGGKAGIGATLRNVRFEADLGPKSQYSIRSQPRYRENAASSAVTPINPAAQKFRLFIRRRAFDNSPRSISSAAGFAVGKRHIADMNQKIAEPHAAIMIPIQKCDILFMPDVM